MKRIKLLGYYDYTVILTYTGMLCALVAIMMEINNRFLDAVMLLMIAGICDMFDGAVASTKTRDKSEKRFGVQIDSLSDLISFGVMPGLFTYMICQKSRASAVVACMYVLAALIRLAYFNVTEEFRQDQTTECRKCYSGVPVTTIAVLLPLVFLLVSKGRIPDGISFIVMLVVCAIGFVSPFEIKKPKLAGKIALIAIGLTEIIGIVILRVTTGML